MFNRPKKYKPALWKQIQLDRAAASGESPQPSRGGNGSKSGAAFTERQFVTRKVWKRNPYKKSLMPGETADTFKKSSAKLKRVSSKMSRLLNLYALLKKEFMVRNPMCAVILNSPAEDIHHTRARISTLLLDCRFWKAVSRETHLKIHTSPELATKCGLMDSENWNRAPDDEITRRLDDVIMFARRNHDGDMKQARGIIRNLIADGEIFREFKNAR